MAGRPAAKTAGGTALVPKDALRRHPLDPISPHLAAEVFGKLEAEGLLYPGAGAAVLREYAQKVHGVDPIGLSVRLIWVLNDSLTAVALDRRECARAVATAVQRAVIAREPWLVVVAVAERARGRLSIAEAHEIAAEEALREMRLNG